METLRKGPVSAYFRAICQKPCGNCVFPQNVHTRKLGEVTVLQAVVSPGFYPGFLTLRFFSVASFVGIFHCNIVTAKFGVLRLSWIKV